LFNLNTTEKNRKALYSGLVAGIAVVCVVVGIALKDHFFSQPVTAPQDIPLVRALTINPVNSAQGYTYSGDVRGRYESKLAFQVSGKITKRNVELGSIVHADDVLMEIDGKDIQQTVNMNSAQVASAQAQLKLAENNLNRYRQLYEQQAISQSQLDQYQSAYETALAAANQSSAQYFQGTNQLSYSALRADSAGVVSSITAEAGQVATPGQTVITLVRDGNREIEINVPENRIDTLRKAAEFKVNFWALPNVAVEGKIREIAPMADAVSRTYKVRISLINAPPEIKLGMTAAVAVAGFSDQPTTVTSIPLSAIYQTNDSPSVWVVNGDIVNLRPIKTGSFGNTQIQVLAGLSPGETIITAGVHKLREGQQVNLVGGDSK